MEDSVRKKGKFTILYEDPDNAVMGANAKLIKKLNLGLKSNPELPLPDGFSKIKEKEFDYIYSVPEYLGGEKLKICMEILDDTLNDLFSFHILEPLVEVKEVFKAK